MKYGHRDVTSCCGRRPQRAMQALPSSARAVAAAAGASAVGAACCWGREVVAEVVLFGSLYNVKFKATT